MIKTYRHRFQQTKSDILKTKGKLNITKNNIVDDHVTHTLTTRNMKSVQ